MVFQKILNRMYLLNNGLIRKQKIKDGELLSDYVAILIRTVKPQKFRF